jgi:hypothetical protein
VLEEKISYCLRMDFSESELFEKFDGEPFNENQDDGIRRILPSKG